MKYGTHFICVALLMSTLCSADQTTAEQDIKAAESQLLTLVQNDNREQAVQHYRTLLDTLVGKQKIRRNEWYEVQRLDDNLLLIASFLGHAAIVRELLKQGEYIGAKSYHGCTALHLAVLAKRAKVVKILLDYGADMTGSNGYSETPLYLVLSMTALSAHPPTVDEIVALFELYGAEIKKNNQK